MQTVDSTRPQGIQVTTAFMAAILCAESAFGIYTMRRISGLFENASRGFHIPALFTGGASLVGTAIAAVFVYFFWQGQNVARWAVLIDSGLVLLNAIGSIFTLMFMQGLLASPGLHLTLYLGASLNLLKACLAGFFFWYLNQPHIKQWFQRSSNQGGAQAPPGYASPYAAPYSPPYAAPRPTAYAPAEPTSAPPQAQPEPEEQRPPGFTV